MSEKMSAAAVSQHWNDAIARMTTAEVNEYARRADAREADLQSKLSALQREADGLREALAVHEKRTAFMRKISPHVAAMLDEYDAPVAAVLSEGCGSPQDRSSEEKQ